MNNEKSKLNHYYNVDLNEFVIRSNEFDFVKDEVFELLEKDYNDGTAWEITRNMENNTYVIRVVNIDDDEIGDEEECVFVL